MKKTYWLGLAFGVVIGVSMGLTAFAEEAKTNCIGDESGKTNCVSPAIEEEPIGAAHLAVDVDEISFGRITELGRRYSKTITIRNNSSEKITINVEKVAYEEGIDESLSALDWVAFVGGKRKFEIRGKDKLQLGVRLIVPSGVVGGTYYAKIKISDGNEDLDKYVTVRADIVTEDYRYGGEIIGQSISFVNLSKKVSTRALLKNNGTAGIKVKYTVNYKNAFGLPEWKSLKEENIELLPGRELDLSVEGKDEVGYGFFTVEQKISYIDAEGQAKEAILSHAVINLPWWSLMIMGGALVLTIVLVIVVKRHRYKVEEAKKKDRTKKSKRKLFVEVVEDD